MGLLHARSLLLRSAAALVLCVAMFLAGALLPLQGLGVPQAMASEIPTDAIPAANCWVNLSTGKDTNAGTRETAPYKTLTKAMRNTACKVTYVTGTGSVANVRVGSVRTLVAYGGTVMQRADGQTGLTLAGSTLRTQPDARLTLTGYMGTGVAVDMTASGDAAAGPSGWALKLV